ncbi:hypothetical protein GALMADRAFT_257237 [Galerina marginata CBS 339.88]|uniref:Secreted protein n=1 Tax=Galerina marginata (strain CBS 339.88) TaxID=685588 RepID=A0A067SDY4_GALM3|nr:hypothetical protein GALMADRAFT_257237 [Galerina marginata CBS 339.88]
MITRPLSSLLSRCCLLFLSVHVYPGAGRMTAGLDSGHYHKIGWLRERFRHFLGSGVWGTVLRREGRLGKWSGTGEVGGWCW